MSEAHRESEHWSMCNFKLQTGNLPLKLPECNLGNPPQNATCNAPQNTQNCKESARWMLLPGHFWQRASNDGNHLATHLKIRIQCPEPTTNYDLATGNAPETTKRISNHIASCPANMNWNEDLGKKRWERGTPPPPPKKVKGGKQQGIRKPRTNPDFGRAMI